MASTRRSAAPRVTASGASLGSLAYMAFDIAALGFAFAAVGAVPVFGTLVLGYLIGQLGNLIPLPGGVGGTEGALIGVFALYGVTLTQATAAVAPLPPVPADHPGGAREHPRSSCCDAS